MADIAKALSLIIVASTTLLPTHARLKERGVGSSDAERYVMDKFLNAEQDPLVEADRVVTLGGILARFCNGIHIKQSVLKNFMQKSGLSHLGKEEMKDVSNSSSARFDYLDVDTLSILCSDADQFFGSNGRLVKGLMTFDTEDRSMK